MKSKRLPKQPVELIPVLRFVQWARFSRPGKCAKCLSEIKDSSFGYIEPESDLRYHYDCMPAGKWRVI